MLKEAIRLIQILSKTLCYNSIYNQEEGGVPKPNKFTVNETKNKFETQKAANQATAYGRPSDMNAKAEPAKPAQVECEKKKDDNCLVF